MTIKYKAKMPIETLPYVVNVLKVVDNNDGTWTITTDGPIREGDVMKGKTDMKHYICKKELKKYKGYRSVVEEYIGV